jgi:hypothetical protein
MGRMRRTLTAVNERRYNTPALPVAEPAPPTAPCPRRIPPQAAKVTLVDEANALVDAFAAVLERALKTHEGRVKPDEVRALLITAYIQRGKHAA